MAGDRERKQDKAVKQALKQAYKLAFPAMGVYVIRNLGNGWLYVDQSSDLNAALNRHRAELRFGTHRNRALQRDWQVYGEAQFRFEILEQIAERNEADFDYLAERVRCLDAWRQKILREAPGSYH